MTPAPDWILAPAATPNAGARRSAEARQCHLIKPPGALGELEALAVRLAGLQGVERPRADRVHITVFAADHGVAREGVSAFPQAVTGEMVLNFARGNAAISVLARELGATLEVVNLGTVEDIGPRDGVITDRLGPGSANLAREAAMRPPQLARALAAGRGAVERAEAAGADLFIGAEMGIGNTTAAAALVCALLDLPPEQVAGPGSGVGGAGVGRKISVIRGALERHRTHTGSPLEALRRLGGFDIAALAGSFVACAQRGLPVLIDGFIAGAAALAATRLCPEAAAWMVHAHLSAEPGHRHVLAALRAQPLLDLRLRLGEGSGAALAVPLLRMACTLHDRMATFAQAGVSQGQAKTGDV